MSKKSLVLVCSLVMAGCTESFGTGGLRLGGKPQFYEYDGGMINLDQVSVVATRATISVSAEPRKPEGESGSEAQALYEAHQQFCRQSLSDEWVYNGGIEGSATALAGITSKIATNISTEVLDTCKIKVKTSAAIVLDNFTITQAEGEYLLPLASEVRMDKEGELAKAVSALLEDNVREPADWEAQYSELKSKVSL
jgi:hypothetical protein